MYKALEINYEIPEILQDAIDVYLAYLNSGEPIILDDIYRSDIDADLKGCDLCLTKEQIRELREYYVFGGIYSSKE